MTTGHLSRVERGERAASGRVRRAYLELISATAEGAESHREPRHQAVLTELFEVHLLANGDLDWYDTWVDIEVVGEKSMPWTVASGPRAQVAETAYEVLDGPELVYDERRHWTTITLELPAGRSTIGLRTWEPTDTNIITIEAVPSLRVDRLEFVVHVPAEITAELDLRRIQHMPPDVADDLPLRYQSPIRVRPETRIGFEPQLSGCWYGIGWMTPDIRETRDR